MQKKPLIKFKKCFNDKSSDETRNRRNVPHIIKNIYDKHIAYKILLF
jgi:hypothetical protein